MGFSVVDQNANIMCACMWTQRCKTAKPRGVVIRQCSCTLRLPVSVLTEIRMPSRKRDTRYSVPSFWTSNPTVSLQAQCAFLRRSKASGLEESLPCPGGGVDSSRDCTVSAFSRALCLLCQMVLKRLFEHRELVSCVGLCVASVLRNIGFLISHRRAHRRCSRRSTHRVSP